MKLTLHAQAILYKDKALREALTALDKGLITDDQYVTLKLEIEKTAREMQKGVT